MSLNTQKELGPAFSAAMKSKRSDGAVSLEEACDIFDLLADEPDIAFGFLADGCYARAHLAHKKLVDLGLYVQKAWAFPADRIGSETPVLLASLLGEKYGWYFHVAPALTVVVPDGSLQKMIIDPSMFDGPVTKKEWACAMGAPAEKVQISDFGIPPTGYIGSYCALWADDDPQIRGNINNHAERKMKDYLLKQAPVARPLLPSIARQTLEKGNFGRTWKTRPLPAIRQTL